MRVMVLSGSLVLMAVAVYALTNSSGHTSVQPYLGMVVFLPLAAVGLVGLVRGKGSGSMRRMYIAAMIVGLLGAALLVLLDRADILLQYETWIERGMP